MVEGYTVLLGVVRRRSQRFRGHLYPMSPFLCHVGMANFKLPAFASGFLCRQTQRYGSMELCLLWRLPRTRYNEHGRTETVQSLYGDQGPLRPGNSHVQIHKVLSSFSPDSYKLIYFSEKETTSATHHPSPEECSNTLRHPSPHLISQPPILAHSSTFTAVPHLSSLSQPLILPQSHPRL